MSKLSLLKKLKNVIVTDKLPPGTKVGKQHRPAVDVGEAEVNYRLDTVDDTYYAVKDGKVVGHIGLEDGKVRTVYVDPEARRGGIATSMYKKVADDYKGIESDDLDAMEPEAKKLWKKMKYDSYPQYSVSGGYSNKPFKLSPAKKDKIDKPLEAERKQIPIAQKIDKAKSSMHPRALKAFNSLPEHTQRRLLEESISKFNSPFAQGGYLDKAILRMGLLGGMAALAPTAEGSVTGLEEKLSADPSQKYKRRAEFSEKADAWLDENINQPLAKRGMPGLGAGISAAGSTLASLFDSEDNVTALSVPGAGNIGKKAAKKLSKQEYMKRLDDEIKAAEKASTKEPTINYKDLKMPTDQGYGSKLKYGRKKTTQDYVKKPEYTKLKD